MTKPIPEGKSDKAYKRKPIEERVAAMLVKTAYRDIRDGFGGMTLGELGDQAVAGALGMVITAEGKLAAMVLETHYGCTLMHSRIIRHAWEDHERRPGMTQHETCVMRFAGELAIRQHASVRYSWGQIADYEYLLCTRRQTLRKRLAEASCWLEAIHGNALAELKKRMGPALLMLRTKGAQTRIPS